MKKTVDKIEDVFVKIYDELNDGIFRYCYFKTSNRDVALELTQETFTKAWEYLSEGKIIKDLKPFLYRIATNLVIDYYRKKKASSLDTLIESGFDVSNGDFEGIVSSSEGREMLEYVHKLDPKYREVLILRYVNDLSVKEIALLQDETENTISVRIHRGLEQIRTEYGIEQ